MPSNQTGSHVLANPREAAPRARGPWIAAAAERIRNLPGVLGATLHTRKTPVGGLGPRTPEEIAAQALFPAAKRLGEALGVGRVVLAIGRGAQRIVLLVFARDHQLTVLLPDDETTEDLKAQIRALLTPPA